MGNSIQVGPRQYASIYHIFRECVQALDVFPEPGLFVSQNPSVNSYALGKNQPYIVLNTGLLDLLDEAEIRVVLAHELGHIKCGHPTLNQMAMWAMNLASTIGASFKRIPYFCSGCPHNTSTKVPEGSRALAGIGCHYMVTWMDRDTATFTQMGGEGAAWIGQAPFTETPHVFQNIGDGTYFHSGILAIRATVASGVNITYKILYNDAVAMTGGQHVDGNLSVEQLIVQLEGEGVQRIALVSDDPEKYPEHIADRHRGLSIHHRDRLEGVQRELRAIPGTTVLIYDQVCATELRRRRKRGQLPVPERRVFINERVCEGCGDCGVQSNCLSVVPAETPLGRKRAIDQSACNQDYSCLKGFCPSFVSVHGGKLKRSQNAAVVAEWPALPAPVLPALDAPFNILLPGVGGMGVLTLGAVLGMAAHLEGRGALVMTQTGLAQKFGAVTAHVRIAPRPEDIHAHCISRGGAHLLLGTDLVVASGRESLARLAPDARAVVNSHEAPTADFTHNPDAPFPGRAMEEAVQAATTEAHFIDVATLARALMGDAIAANFMLLGQAWQLGLIPVTEAALTEAIRLNGVAIEQNLRAFTWGRRYAADAEAVRRAAGIAEIDYAEPAQTLDQLIDDRANNRFPTPLKVSGGDDVLVAPQAQLLAGRSPHQVRSPSSPMWVATGLSSPWI